MLTFVVEENDTLEAERAERRSEKMRFSLSWRFKRNKKQMSKAALITTTAPYRVFVSVFFLSTSLDQELALPHFNNNKRKGEAAGRTVPSPNR